MITEDYVSFEVAKLLKEKGFNNNYPKGDCTQYACTLQMAMKWLREIHNLHIMVNCVGKVNYDPIVQRFDGKDFEIDGVEVGTTKHINGKYVNVRRGFKTYENACDTALKYALENLI